MPITVNGMPLEEYIRITTSQVSLEYYRKWCAAKKDTINAFLPKERGPHPNPLGDGMLGAPFHQEWSEPEADACPEAS